jgi:hypothetical protein
MATSSKWLNSPTTVHTGGTIRWKVIGVALDAQTTGLEDFRKLQAEIAISKENNAQAARS